MAWKRSGVSNPGVHRRSNDPLVGRARFSMSARRHERTFPALALDNAGNGSQVSWALDAAERAVLDQLLNSEFPGVRALRDQVVDVQVVGRCDCGCPSIHLDASRDHPQAPVSDGLAQRNCG